MATRFFCIDATHGTDAYCFQLTVSPDDFGKGKKLFCGDILEEYTQNSPESHIHFIMTDNGTCTCTCACI